MEKVIKITVLSLLAIVLVGGMITLMQNNFKFKTTSKKIYDEEYAIEDINNFNINLKSHDVEILESENEKIRVVVYAKDKDVIKLYVDDNKNVNITKNHNSSGICFGICINNKNIVKVYLPKEYDGKFDISATSGDIESSVENYLDYKIRLTSGDITMKNVNSLEGKTTSGDIEIESLGSHINFKATSGDFEINKFTVKKDSSITVTSGDVEIDKISDAYVTANVKSGDIKIKDNDRYAKYELKIKTTSGDVTVG